MGFLFQGYFFNMFCLVKENGASIRCNVWLFRLCWGGGYVVVEVVQMLDPLKQLQN